MRHKIGISKNSTHPRGQKFDFIYYTKSIQCINTVSLVLAKCDGWLFTWASVVIGFSTISMTSSEGCARGWGSDTYTILSPDPSVYTHTIQREIDRGGGERERNSLNESTKVQNPRRNSYAGITPCIEQQVPRTFYRAGCVLYCACT